MKLFKFQTVEEKGKECANRTRQHSLPATPHPKGPGWSPWLLLHPHACSLLSLRILSSSPTQGLAFCGCCFNKAPDVGYGRSQEPFAYTYRADFYKVFLPALYL